ncbi:MAG: TRAP transporter substrate-binding protein [Hyphomonadaceae bacterium]|nr:TRAP transporter substrate-binding protein [Hyphomonadaceae bacterium]
MKRRYILAGAAALATGAGVVGVLGRRGTRTVKRNVSDSTATPAINKNRRKLRMVTSWPKDFPGLGEMPKRFSRAVYDITEGRLDIKVYAAGELVGALECFDATSTGAADMYHSAEYYWQGRSKAFSFFTAVPMGMTAVEIMGWVEFGGGQALWDELSGNFNIKPLQAGNTGHQTGGWFKREMNSLEDFKGLKIRMPGLGGEVIRRLGGAAVRLSGGEIYQALQSGAIDATEWVGPWNDLALGFYREAPLYYAPGFHEPGAALSIGINLDIWNSLSTSDRALIKFAAKAANDTSLAEYTFENARALATLKNIYGVEPGFFSDEIMVTIGRVAEEVVREFGQADTQTQKVYDSYIKARNACREWTEMGDGRYIRARKAALGG